MLIKFPKDDSRFRWTRHIKNKMLFYGLSESRIRAVVRNPKRVEEGIAPQTVAAMQPKASGKKKEEIWVMYRTAKRSQTDADLNADSRRQDQENGQRMSASRLRQSAPVLMISAWRYPGVTKPGAPVPIPDDIAAELDQELEAT